MLTDEEIEIGKVHTVYSLPSQVHEHPDCIRLAYEWLDAQPKTKRPGRLSNTNKHWIEQWAGRYVSRSDVEVAATLHPDVHGRYPFYNIGSRIVIPHERRLVGIGEARTQHYGIPANDRLTYGRNRREEA